MGMLIIAVGVLVTSAAVVSPQPFSALWAVGLPLVVWGWYQTGRLR